MSDSKQKPESKTEKSMLKIESEQERQSNKSDPNENFNQILCKSNSKFQFKIIFINYL